MKSIIDVVNSIKTYTDNKDNSLKETLTNQINVSDTKNFFKKNWDYIIKNNTGGTWSGNTYVFRGVTFVFNDDGTVDVSGANGSNAAYVRCAHGAIQAKLSNGVYVVSKGVATNTRVNVSVTVDGTYYKDTDNTGKTFTIDSTHQCTAMTIEVLANTTISETITLKPMICLKSIYDLDPTWEPYAKTNQQLTKDTWVVDNTEVNGAVNMLPNLGATEVNAGITWTVNDDGTVTANGTQTGQSTFYCIPSNNTNIILPAGTYKFSACPQGGSGSTYRAKLYTDGGTTTLAQNYRGSTIFTISQPTPIQCLLRIEPATPAQTLSNLVFKPMITVVSYDGDYVPYAKSNKELTEDVLDLEDRLKTAKIITILGIPKQQSATIRFSDSDSFILLSTAVSTSNCHYIGFGGATSSGCNLMGLTSIPSALSITTSDNAITIKNISTSNIQARISLISFYGNASIA